MLFGTTTDFYSSLGAVSGSFFNDIWPYLIVVMGIPLAFFIIEMLIDLLPRNKEDKRVEDYAAKVEKDYNNLDWEGKKK